MRVYLLTLILTLFELASFSQNKQTFIYDADTLHYKRINDEIKAKLQTTEPGLLNNLNWISKEFDKCQEDISSGKKPNLHGRVNVSELMRVVGLVYTEYHDMIGYQSYKNELAFYGYCKERMYKKQELAKELAEKKKDSVENAYLNSFARRETPKTYDAGLTTNEKDSVRNLRSRFDHDYGTIFGDVPVFDVSIFEWFMQSPDYMNLSLVDGATKELPNGYRNVYETKSGQRYLLNIDYTLGKKNGRTIIRKFKMHGYFDLVVKFYIFYWPFTLQYADFDKPGEITNYFITDKIVFRGDLIRQRASIEITKAAN